MYDGIKKEINTTHASSYTVFLNTSPLLCFSGKFQCKHICDGDQMLSQP